MLENFYLNKHKILEKSHQNFLKILSKNSDSHHLKIGCELEFFLLDKNNNKIQFMLDTWNSVQGSKNLNSFVLSLTKPQMDSLVPVMNKYLKDFYMETKNREVFNRGIDDYQLKSN